jgi:hypothetical protein
MFISWRPYQILLLGLAIGWLSQYMFYIAGVVFGFILISLGLV